MRSRLLLAALTVTLSVSACSTIPTQYYMIDMQPSGGAQPAVNLALDRLNLAEAIADGRLAIKTSPTELTYYAGAHWANSVDELVREKLAAEFGPQVSGRKSIAISGHLHAFEQIDRPDGSAEAHVKMAVAFREKRSSRYADPLLEKVYEHSVPAQTADARGVVSALTICLEEIAAEMIRDSATL